MHQTIIASKLMELLMARSFLKRKMSERHGNVVRLAVEALGKGKTYLGQR